MDAEVEARDEGRLDGSEAADLGLSTGDDDLEKLGDNGVDVVVDGAERGDEFWSWVGAEESIRSDQYSPTQLMSDSPEEDGDHPVKVRLRLKIHYQS